MAKIERVSRTAYEFDTRYFVTYDSGTVREYSADKLPKTVISWIEKNQLETVNPTEGAAKVAAPEEPEIIEAAETVETATTETETEITPATAAAEYITEIPEIIENQINGFDFWYDTNIGKFIVLYCGDEVIFDSVVDAWKFSAEMRKAEEDAETAETEEPEQDADEEPETATPAAMVPIIQEPVTKPATVTKYKPASEVVAFGLCMVLAYAWFFLRGAAELLIIMIQNIWSHREEYAEKVRKIIREQIRPAAILTGYMAKDTAKAAAIWTVETGKQLATAAAIMAFMVRIYSN